MRFYRYIGAAIVVTAVVLFSAVAFAEQVCVPLPQVAKDLVEAKVPNESLSKLCGDDITKLYLAAAKVDVEKDSDPIGVFFITLPDKIIGSIVEAAGCVKYSFVLPQAAHEAAMNQVASSI
ncbi:hypothetical protein J0664_06165 [Rhizobium leguminosarum]|uniref:hypothetical protein n=1 Tax=Rhizobium leguminosarum TaxID=384 RepID=UPI001A90D18E|nr:hypothetical protein [Rhizobium leguminosarum]MBY5553704.1 hypothetical protein [Rhizobium leguminosarum]QSW24881.1 hypothetical protein J0664_06165 [Rhizobium leguminosarum]